MRMPCTPSRRPACLHNRSTRKRKINFKYVKDLNIFLRLPLTSPHIRTFRIPDDYARLLFPAIVPRRCDSLSLLAQTFHLPGRRSRFSPHTGWVVCRASRRSCAEHRGTRTPFSSVPAWSECSKWALEDRQKHAHT